MSERLYTRAELEAAAHQAAGAASVPMLIDHPDYVFPAEQVHDAVMRALELYDYEEPSAMELCEAAWGIIANAHRGVWEDASDEWRGAAERWRDLWHRLLGREHASKPDAEILAVADSLEDIGDDLRAARLRAAVRGDVVDAEVVEEPADA